MSSEEYRVTGQNRILIHRDLENAAYYFRTRIEKRMKEGDIEGLSHERMACMVLLAFSFEAYINFVGNEVIGKWNEREAFHKKLNIVLEDLKIQADWKKRPYSSIERLKKVRDLLAHGKPIIQKVDVVVKERGGREEEDATNIDHAWEDLCKYEVVFETYDDVDAIWRQLIDASRIDISENQTSSDVSIEVIRPAKKTK